MLKKQILNVGILSMFIFSSMSLSTPHTALSVPRVSPAQLRRMGTIIKQYTSKFGGGAASAAGGFAATYSIPT